MLSRLFMIDPKIEMGCVRMAIMPLIQKVREVFTNQKVSI